MQAFERPALLRRTPREVISLGASCPPPDRLLAAARAACALGFIERLPAGLDTVLDEAPLPHSSRSFTLSGPGRRRHEEFDAIDMKPFSSRTVRLRKTRRPCGTRATPCAAITSGARPVTVFP